MFKKIKNIPNIANIASITNLMPQQSTKQVKQNIEKKVDEKNKLYGYIGMEAHDLYEQGKIDVAELTLYFEKLATISEEITELELEKKKIEDESKSKNVCSCGQAIKNGVAFCPNCGKAVGKPILVCVCGKKLSKDLKFCPDCGKTVSMESSQQAAPIEMKECICGANISAEQTMCMECGRKI